MFLLSHKIAKVKFCHVSRLMSFSIEIVMNQKVLDLKFMNLITRSLLTTVLELTPSMYSLLRAESCQQILFGPI